MPFLRLTLCSILLLASCFAGVEIYMAIGVQRTYKTDLIEISKVKYGIFSVDEWKLIIAEIIAKKIEEFDLQGEDREVMRARIEEFLQEAVNQIEEAFANETNRTSFMDNPIEWANQQIRGGVSDLVDVFGTIRREIPELTENVLTFLDKEENRDNLKHFILNQINSYVDRTFAQTDYTLHDQITAKYGHGNRATAKSELQRMTMSQSIDYRPYLYMLITAFIGSVLFIFLSKKLSGNELILLSLISLIFLAGGLALPMIEIDARIEQFNFQLLGEPVSFSDQVLYYKSKSINEIVTLLLSQGKLEVFLVGVLVLTFSVVFPLLKLIATVIYSTIRSLRQSKILKFFIFKTGKWSMADVLVVAILMAYIGFDGIISDQLKQLSSVTATTDILTTNQSNLQLGFFLFTGFVLLSLLISHRMQYQDGKTHN